MKNTESSHLKEIEELFSEKRELAEGKLKELIKEVEEIAKDEGFLPIFSFLVWFSVFHFSIEKMRDAHPEQSYSEGELAVMAGILLKVGVSKEIKVIDHDRFEKTCHELWGIFHQIHGCVM